MLVFFCVSIFGSLLLMHTFVLVHSCIYFALIPTQYILSCWGLPVVFHMQEEFEENFKRRKIGCSSSVGNLAQIEEASVSSSVLSSTSLLSIPGLAGQAQLTSVNAAAIAAAVASINASIAVSSAAAPSAETNSTSADNLQRPSEEGKRISKWG